MHSSSSMALRGLPFRYSDKACVWFCGRLSGRVGLKLPRACAPCWLRCCGVAVDYETPAYISEERFPECSSRCCPAAAILDEPNIAANPGPIMRRVNTRVGIQSLTLEACVWSIRNNLHYIGKDRM